MANQTPKTKDTALPATPSGPPVEQEGSSWALNYDGPMAKVDDRSCDCCNAASTGKCGKTSMQHGPDFGKPGFSCPSCHAATQKRCEMHCGIGDAVNVAIARADAPVTNIARILSQAIVEAQKDKPECTNIHAKAGVYYDNPDLHPGTIVLEITLKK